MNLSVISEIRGVNYLLDENDEAEWKRDLDLGLRARLNSVRLFLKYDEYARDENRYIRRVADFAGMAGDMGYTVTPILFNGNEIYRDDPWQLEESFIPRAEKYALDMVGALKGFSSLLLYDIMNEPGCNRMVMDAKNEEEKQFWLEKQWRFVRRFCLFVREADPEHGITVGHWLAQYAEQAADLVDVISYHDYSSSVKGIRESAMLAREIGKKYGKPVINTETCCVGRANSYDLVIQTLNELKMPWYFFGLTTLGYWGDIHGVFYPDGSVRDPAAVAALMGFYRNRDLNTIRPENVNRECLAKKAIDRLSKLLGGVEDSFQYREPTVYEILDVCEEMANFLEAGQLCAMCIPPTARVYAWRGQENPDRAAIIEFAYELARKLRQGCHIL